MTAAFLPVGAFTAGAAPPPDSRTQSAANRSSLPMDTAFSAPPSALPTAHRSWHCFSWGQTLPHTAGRRFVSLMTAAAARKSPDWTAAMNRGMGTPTGQPAAQGASLQPRQRRASTSA